MTIPNTFTLNILMLVVLTACTAEKIDAGTEDMTGKSLAEIQALLGEGKITSVDLVGQLLDKADRYSHLNAFIGLDRERAIGLAEAADNERLTGAKSKPLLGVPLLVKDNIHVAGLKNTAGTPALKQFVPESSNAVIKTLQGWDRQSLDEDADGQYDGAATAIFRTFVEELLQNVLSDDLGDVFGPFGNTGYPTAAKPTGAGTNIQSGMKAVIESLAGRGDYDLLNGEASSAIVARSLSEAIESLRADQSNDVTAYRMAVAARPFSNINFLGVPQASDEEILVTPIEQNRGTENNMMIMRVDAIEGWKLRRLDRAVS